MSDLAEAYVGRGEAPPGRSRNRAAVAVRVEACLRPFGCASGPGSDYAAGSDSGSTRPLALMAYPRVGCPFRHVRGAPPPGRKV